MPTIAVLYWPSSQYTASSPRTAQLIQLDLVISCALEFIFFSFLVLGQHLFRTCWGGPNWAFYFQPNTSNSVKPIFWQRIHESQMRNKYFDAESRPVLVSITEKWPFQWKSLHIYPTVLPKAMTMKAAHGLNNVFRNNSFRNVSLFLEWNGKSTSLNNMFKL